VGVKTNRAAIGAQITVRSKGGREGSVLRYREVVSGGSFGASSLVQHVGLGRAERIESVEVFWPASRTRQVFRDVPVDASIEVRELAASYAIRPASPQVRVQAVP
jgi:hypothetical protein